MKVKTIIVSGLACAALICSQSAMAQKAAAKSTQSKEAKALTLQRVDSAAKVIDGKALPVDTALCPIQQACCADTTLAKPAKEENRNKRATARKIRENVQKATPKKKK